MKCNRWFALWFWLAACPFLAAGADEDWRALLAAGQLAEVIKADPSIVVELRYATARNGVGAAVYPADFPCLVRPEVASHLRLAQRFLRAHGRGLKVWDAYRPVAAQRALWERRADKRFVADPTVGRGSLHTWGLAVDVTLVDADGKDVPMPTDFDVFARSASGIYRGGDAQVRENLRLLQYAMMREGGFQGLSTEWWHFSVRDWQKYEAFDAKPKR